MKILIFKIGALGDVIMTTPFVRQLRKNYPYSQINYLVGNSCSKILNNNHSVDRVITFNEEIFSSKKIFGWLKLISLVRKEKYDLVFILDKHWVFNFTGFLFGIKNRIGFDREGREGVFLTKKVYYGPIKNEIIYYLDLISKSGGVVDYEDTKTEIFFKQSARKIVASYYVIVNSGGDNFREKTNIRIMPSSLFEELVLSLSNKNKVFLLGSGNDKNYYAQFNFKGKNILNMAGLNLEESLDIMAKAKQVITTDCGAMHMAGAVAGNLVCVFGPTHPKRKAPMRDGVRVVWKNGACYDGRYEIYGKIPHKKKYMENIEVCDILDKKYLSN